MPQPKPFTFEPPQAAIDDLRRRIRATRWPDQIENIGWDFGVERTELKKVAIHWADSFDFTAQFARLNAFPNFTTTVSGDSVPLHFIHVRSDRADAKPLLLIHGWPGSVIEFFDIIPLLTRPKSDTAPAFHLVIPSLPGYGFSPAPTRSGVSTLEMARAFNQLMIQLGYIKYFAQGGDWGSIIARDLAVHHALNCVGIHINMAAFQPPRTATWIPSLVAMYANKGTYVLSPEEWEWVKETQKHQETGTGYMHYQTTAPQALAYGLNDSPVGLLAWIYEKFYRWTHHLGDVTQAVPIDKILLNVSIYWFTNTIASSLRLYRETLGKKNPGTNLDGTVVLRNTHSNGVLIHLKCSVITAKIANPVGVAVFPKELYKAPKSWVKHYTNLQHWTVMNRGGHFAALEEPALLADDIQECFGKWVADGLVKLD
ncbi:epocide hydrolase domain-containing protein [Blastocladiella britannica]|nr:epocide hydrolase domain-containing protein [Blastocladiella britannica]